MTKVFGIGLALLLSIGSAAAPVQAQSPAEVTADYDFFVGGFRIAEVGLKAVLDKQGYKAQSSVTTRGVLDVLLRGRAASHAVGMRGDYGQLVPVGFATHYRSRTADQKILISYEDSNPAEITFEPKVTDSDQHAKPAERPGSLDPLTAAVATLIPSTATDLCNRSIPVFDGKRRFDIIFLPPDPKRFDESAPAPEWNKPLTRCLGVYERMSGFGEDVNENQRYFPFDIWFEDSGNGIFRAVRLAGSTKLGFAIGNLRPAE